ncbi:MAG: glycosyltransferase [Candidatus Acidiferrales bacterium]
MPGWLPAEGYFLYASTLDYYKGQLAVVRAYRQLKQQRHTPEKLILAGPEYPEYGRLVREEVRKLRLEDDVLIPGTISSATRLNTAIRGHQLSWRGSGSRC